MQFGYFANTNNRNNEKPYGQVLSETVELAQHCDGANWHSIWFTEHHFGHEGYEVCPNPVMMGTWVAAHTEKLRIGQAANIITFWHPLRFAEDLAMLDHMSGGRVECAVGRGLYGREALNLNKTADTANPEQNFRVFKDTLEVIRRAWSNEFFEFDGEMMTYPEPGFQWDHAMSPKSESHMDLQTNELTKLALVPRPLQQPGPPMWQVVDSPLSIDYAARNGLQCMMWIPPVDALKPRFEHYRDTRAETEGRDVRLGEGVALVRDMFVTETMAEAEKLAGDGLLDYLRWVCHWRGLRNHLHPGEGLPNTNGKLDSLNYEWLHPRNLLFGTPDYVCEKIEELKTELGLETLLVWSSFPGVDHDAAMRSVKLFSEEVMPRFSPASNNRQAAE
jgi:alkanesulfonate monooxygenase SsuD/methylene tetrahydromethanopterin reductase-like flavin-dependent oxidoreductase (luciferase family)